MQISPNIPGGRGAYVLATGEHAAGRLELLHSIYSGVGHEVLLEAGVSRGMHAVDFGCGSGAMTRLLASMVGRRGAATGIDLHAAQVEQARRICAREGFKNTGFLEADACNTGLPSDRFDVAYCRFLLLHLTDPLACLREMHRVLKPGGILVVEDGDLESAFSIPATALNSFVDLFCRMGTIRGVDFSVERRLAPLVAAAGFRVTNLKVHQPADCAGANALFLKWSVEEAGPSFVQAGLITLEELQRTLYDMEKAVNDPGVLTVSPRMSVVAARKVDGGGIDSVS